MEPWLGPGAIAAWQLPGSRWGVAIERDGSFHRAPTPGGPGPAIHLGEDFNYVYDLATSGTMRCSPGSRPTDRSASAN